MKIVITQSRRLDELVFEHYGSLEHFDDVVEVNEELVGKPFLEVGNEVELPTFEPKQIAVTAQTLWD